MTPLGTTARRFAFALLTAVGFILMEAVSGVQAPGPVFAQAAPTVVVPTWSAELADRFPACHKHRTGDVAASVVVVDPGGDAHRYGVDRAWEINHDDEKSNDVWVVGTC